MKYSVVGQKAIVEKGLKNLLKICEQKKMSGQKCSRNAIHEATYKILNNLTQLVGQTPLYEITSYRMPTEVQLFAKLEYFNPGGSINDRLGFYVIQQALKNGDLKRGGTIIEARAGNTGIGLALAAIHYK